MTTQSSTAANEINDSTMLVTMNKMDTKECDTAITTVLGAVIGVLVTLQAVTLTTWTVSCCVKRQQSTTLKSRYT